jgi:hypothetical protein
LASLSVVENLVPTAFNVALDSVVELGEQARFVGGCTGGDVPVALTWSPAPLELRGDTAVYLPSGLGVFSSEVGCVDVDGDSAVAVAGVEVVEPAPSYVGVVFRVLDAGGLVGVSDASYRSSGPVSGVVRVNGVDFLVDGGFAVVDSTAQLVDGDSFIARIDGSDVFPQSRRFIASAGDTLETNVFNISAGELYVESLRSDTLFLPMDTVALYLDDLPIDWRAEAGVLYPDGDTLGLSDGNVSLSLDFFPDAALASGLEYLIFRGSEGAVHTDTLYASRHTPSTHTVFQVYSLVVHNNWGIIASSNDENYVTYWAMNAVNHTLRGTSGISRDGLQSVFGIQDEDLLLTLVDGTTARLNDKGRDLLRLRGRSGRAPGSYHHNGVEYFVNP